MRCVVFGATGNLGTRLIPQLLSAGHQVRVLARSPAKLDDVTWREQDLSRRKVKGMADKKFRKGGEVEWRSHGVTVHGTVAGQITSDTEAAGRTVRASKDEPQYKVRSSKTGADAVHKPDALRHAD